MKQFRAWIFKKMHEILHLQFYYKLLGKVNCCEKLYVSKLFFFIQIFAPIGDRTWNLELHSQVLSILGYAVVIILALTQTTVSKCVCIIHWTLLIIIYLKVCTFMLPVICLTPEFALSPNVSNKGTILLFTILADY